MAARERPYDQRDNGKHTKTSLPTSSGQCLTSDAELWWRRAVVFLRSTRVPDLRRKWAGFLQTCGLSCSWRRRKVRPSIQNIKVVDNGVLHATCVCRPRCLFDCESKVGNPLLARSSSATQHAATGCQGNPCPPRQADAWLAMANSNGEDLIPLSDPIGLQIVAEKWVYFPPSSEIGWQRKSSAIYSKGSSSSTLWWRPPVVSVRPIPWTLSTVLLRVEGCCMPAPSSPRPAWPAFSTSRSSSPRLKEKQMIWEGLAAKPKTTKLDEAQNHQIHTSRLPRMIRNHMYTPLYQAPCQLCLTTSLLATDGISHEGPRFFTLVHPWRTSISFCRICRGVYDRLRPMERIWK